ncbi:MAG: NAD(P)/FAD-dependent oxidoreductase [Gammaproteobacteria bacterium]
MGQEFGEGASLDIAVVGSGIAGLGAAWLLGQQHRVTLYEAEGRLGGHSNTVMVDDAGRELAIDTGFIVYNARNYPNLVALFDLLDVPTRASDMSFAASLDGGRFEYAGGDLAGLFAQPSNLLRGRFWRMLRDVLRFYREAPGYLAGPAAEWSLGELLARHGYSREFARDHLLPMAAAIWSASAEDIGAYPARTFIRFCDNHGLLQLSDRPQWRTVVGGSRTYVARLRESLSGAVHVGVPVTRVERGPRGPHVTTADGVTSAFDHVVLATHADQSLALLADASRDERRRLSAFRYAPNRAMLHTDRRLMPRRRRAWSSWNFLADDTRSELCVSYWMNRLQSLDSARDWFVTLNPSVEPDPAQCHFTTTYAHPQFDAAAIAAQDTLWDIQGQRGTWFCGAWCGYGFHEDGLQAGLLVAEQLGDVARPWGMPAQPSRVALPPAGWRHALASAA